MFRPPDGPSPLEREAQAGDSQPRSVADDRFDTCRWRSARDVDGPPHCSHRDVLPLAGTGGFRADAWCPDCTFYKPRRITRKRNADDGFTY